MLIQLGSNLDGLVSRPSVYSVVSKGRPNFVNCYEDVSRSDAYATLEFANT